MVFSATTYLYLSHKGRATSFSFPVQGPYSETLQDDTTWPLSWQHTETLTSKDHREIHRGIRKPFLPSLP
jgi:hypothetical protein